MTNTALLNNVDHHDLKVITSRGAAFGDAVNQTVVFPTEYGEIQRDYPILFRKDADGEFQSVAMLGFEKGENLFLAGNDWNARYIPAILQRGPFMIGFQDRDMGGETRREPVIHVDLDSPRVSREEGEPLFMEHGGNSPYLQHISRVLKVINEGVAISKAMFAAFEEADLIEAVNMDIKLNESESVTVPGCYTINTEKLAALSGERLEKLHRGGFLQAAYFVTSSLTNVNRLIAMKNRRSMGEAG